MKQAYIHIGPEKTGMTSLRVFQNNIELQLNKAGFAYLCDGLKSCLSGTAHASLSGFFHDEYPRFISGIGIGQIEEHIKKSCEHGTLSSSKHFSLKLYEPEKEAGGLL